MTARILCGDALEMLTTLPDASVSCIVTSPPYFGLRQYLEDGHPDAAREIGRKGAGSPDAYIESLVGVFREARRVLHPAGTFFLNIGDTFASRNWPAGVHAPPIRAGELIGIPNLAMLALRRDGWFYANDNIWAKGCSGHYKGGRVMPDPSKRRCTKAHEFVFMFAKEPDYYFDFIANKEPGIYPAGTRAAKGSAERRAAPGVSARPAEYTVYDGLRTRRDVWTFKGHQSKKKHYAQFPGDLVEFCLLPATSEHGVCPACGAPWKRLTTRHQISERDHAGRTHSTAEQRMGKSPVPERGWEAVYETTGWEPTCGCGREDVVPAVVLDPFCGTGTTGRVAARHGRDFVGIDLSAAFCQDAAADLGIVLD